MYRFVSVLLMSISALLFNCNPVPYGFSTSNLYSRTNFSGKELFEKSISICPLLKDSSFNTVHFLRSDSSFEVLRAVRKDLQFISIRKVEESFLNKLHNDSLLLFYKLLFYGDIAKLQTHDSLWNAINSDYYMVMRMVNASSVKTFNNSVRKRMQIEAELWDCRNQEVVYRTSIKGICLSGAISDGQFVMEALKKALLELPELLPSYGKESW